MALNFVKNQKYFKPNVVCQNWLQDVRERPPLPLLFHA